MLKRITSFLVALLMLFTVLPVIGANAVADYDKVGYIAVRIMPEGDISYHKAFLRGERIYFSANDIGLIAGYTVIDDGLGAVFSRENDNKTMVFYWDGQADTMGHSYEFNTISADEELYFDIEKMLYLLHAQWVVEDNQLVVQPMGENIFEFWRDNWEYINSTGVTIEDLLLNGESIWGFAIRTTLSSLFTDMCARIFYAPARIRADYQEALFLLLQEDTDFFVDDVVNAIDNILENRGFKEIESSWDAIYYIAGLPKNISELASGYNEFVDIFAPSLRFNAWNDIISIDSGILESITEAMEPIQGIRDLYKMLSNIVEVYTRSQNWGEDFIEYITLLSRICATRYGTNGGHIRAAAQALLNEKADPMRAAMTQAGWEFLDAVLFHDKTLTGKFRNVASGVMAILRTSPEINTQIETASKQYTINRLIHVEQIARMESADHYLRYGHFIHNRELLELLFSSPSLGASRMRERIRENSIQVDERAIRDMRSSMMLHLRTTLRNRYFMYQFYTNPSVNSNIDRDVVLEMRQNVYSTYALLIELMNTEQFDNVLVLGSDFRNLHSNEWGRMRVEIPVEVFHEGDIPVSSDIDPYDLYNELLAQYRDAVRSGSFLYINAFSVGESLASPTSKHIILQQAYDGTPSLNVYYTFVDIDRNGVPELLIGIGTNESNRDIYAIFTWVDGQVYFLAGRISAGSGLQQITVHNSSIIVNVSPSGQGQWWSFEKISESGNTLTLSNRLLKARTDLDFISLDEPLYYTVLDWERDQEISQEKFEAIIREYTGQIPKDEIYGDFGDFSMSYRVLENSVLLEWNRLITTSNGNTIDSAPDLTNRDIYDDWKEWFSIPYGEWFGDNPPEAEWWKGGSFYRHPSANESWIVFPEFESEWFTRQLTDYPVMVSIPISRLLGQPSVTVEELHQLYGQAFVVEFCYYYNELVGNLTTDEHYMRFFIESDSNIRQADITRIDS